VGKHEDHGQVNSDFFATPSSNNNDPDGNEEEARPTPRYLAQMMDLRHNDSNRKSRKK
jgi:hypothetical protein